MLLPTRVTEDTVKHNSHFGDIYPLNKLLQSVFPRVLEGTKKTYCLSHDHSTYVKLLTFSFERGLVKRLTMTLTTSVTIETITAKYRK